jgi:hypothetical protein
MNITPMIMKNLLKLTRLLSINDLILGITLWNEKAEITYHKSLATSGGIYTKFFFCKNITQTDKL